MNAEQFQHVKELYLKLEPLSEERRRAMLDAQRVDSAVRAEVEKLLEQSAVGASRLSEVTEQIDRILAPLRTGTQDMTGQHVGPYQIVGQIGQGGMGVVYLGWDTRLARKVALKAVLPGDQQDSQRVERLCREARVLASLSHPNVATVYGLEEAHGTLFLAMEYIDGKTLSQRLGRNAMPIPEALACCEQIAAGLEAAHEAGVIHRDLKPGNVMFTADGVVKVLDFGLARELETNSPVSNNDTRLLTLTRQGSFFGTPAYMSPEQARGEPLDRRSDIYSFGSVLFRCLTGRPAFDGESDNDLIEAILHHEPDWSRLPARTPDCVVAILRRCLAKDPGERYRHIGDIRLDLREARAEKAWERREPAQRPATFIRRFLPWALAVVAIAFAVAQYWRPLYLAPLGRTWVHRFDLTLPDDSVQADLERVQLALSPDGRDIVIACATAEGQALWKRSHVDGQWRRLEQTDGAHRPVFSPDGQWIGFFRAGHYYKRRVSGRGDLLQLCGSTNWYGAGWADDGTFVCAPLWGDPISKITAQHPSPQPASRLDLEQGERSHISPRIIPGQRWMLYNVWKGGEDCDIHATHLDSGEEHLVLTNASSPRVTSTPRGDYILFERSSIVFAAPFDRAAARVTGRESPIADGVMNDGTRFAAYFDVAADGTLVYFPGTSFTEESRMAYVNPDGTTSPFNDERLSFAEPIFSLAGQKLAVAVKGKVYRCLVFDLKSQTREYLLTGGDTVAHAISPDETTIACTVNRDGGYGIDLFSLADGRHLKRIVQPGADYQNDLCWSPDGKLITFATSPREGEARDVWIVNADGNSTPQPLVGTHGADVKPTISPNGRWIAYASDVTGRSEIYVVSCPDGATTRQISTGGGTTPAWSPDGKLLYFISPRGLVSIGITPAGTVTGQPALIYDKPFGQSDPIARDYTIAPDGRPLIVEPSERRPTVSHLHVITNWHLLLP